MKAMTMLAAAAALLLGAGAAPGAASAGDLTVHITGTHAGGGKVMTTLYTRDNFFQAGALHASADPASGEVTVVFHDLPPGDYAFMAFHDENGDGQMARSPMGMPTEGWGMTNAEQLMGPPTFDVLKFSVGAGGASISVPLHYSSGQ